jgi:predicted HD superfamily hydrolase involved in NAD metabolism
VNRLERAARGELPEWAEVSPARLGHTLRVGELMHDWAVHHGLDEADCDRWRGTGTLHDALRDAPASHLHPWVDERFRELPDSFLHGPATAARLEAEGMSDAEVLDAIRYHTLGWPDLGRLGRILIAADYLEPGRQQNAEWRARMRERGRTDLDGVVRDVLRTRIQRCMDADLPVRPEMFGLWNRVVTDESSEGR